MAGHSHLLRQRKVFVPSGLPTATLLRHPISQPNPLFASQARPLNTSKQWRLLVLRFRPQAAPWRQRLDCTEGYIICVKPLKNQDKMYSLCINLTPGGGRSFWWREIKDFRSNCRFKQTHVRQFTNETNPRHRDQSAVARKNKHRPKPDMIENE